MGTGDFGASLGDVPRRDEGRITNAGQQAAYVWTEMSAPVIAAIHGPALGAGFQIALAADIRFIAPDAKMSVLEIRWGLVPDMTGTQMLPRLVGLDVAKELAFTGRMVSGEEAVELGLATHLADDPRAAALELARDIASKSPYAVRGVKKLVNMAGQVPLEEAFKAEERTMGVAHRQLPTTSKPSPPTSKSATRSSPTSSEPSGSCRPGKRQRRAGRHAEAGAKRRRSMRQLSSRRRRRPVHGGRRRRRVRRR